MPSHPVYAGLSTSVFEVISALAREHGALNLGQGFPDDPGPRALRERAAAALLDGDNQYPPSRGVGQLRDAVADHYGRLQGTDLKSEQVLITSGATEGIAAALLALVRPSDEVVIFEPAYDAYRPLIERAGGTAAAVRLKPPGWRLDAQDIEAVLSSRTRLVLFNNPLNPAARVFEDTELKALRDVCLRHDLIVISDEVWEHVIFDGHRHLSILNAPDMADRSVKIGSAGKMFGMTGWKVGFVCGAPGLIEPIAKAHQFLTFSTPPNLQVAVAEGLAWDEREFQAMRRGLQASRDRLGRALSAEGYASLACEGTYFMTLDLAASGLDLADTVFCRRLVTEFGVAAIPMSAFSADGPGRLIRLCFAKQGDALDRAAERLGRARRALR